MFTGRRTLWWLLPSQCETITIEQNMVHFLKNRCMVHVQVQVHFLKNTKNSWQESNQAPHWARLEIQTPRQLRAGQKLMYRNRNLLLLIATWLEETWTILTSQPIYLLSCFCLILSVSFNSSIINQLILKRFGLWTRDTYRVKHSWCRCHLQTGIPHCAISDGWGRPQRPNFQLLGHN